MKKGKTKKTNSKKPTRKYHYHKKNNNLIDYDSIVIKQARKLRQKLIQLEDEHNKKIVIIKNVAKELDSLFQPEV
jgi:hypothetical protein